MSPFSTLIRSILQIILGSPIALPHHTALCIIFLRPLMGTDLNNYIVWSKLYDPISELAHVCGDWPIFIVCLDNIYNLKTVKYGKMDLFH